MSTAYDEVQYPTTAFRQTSPDRLATHATLLGLPFAPPGRCRLLDIGGGDAMNVIAMAVTHPGSEFVSFDLSQSAVRRGQAAIDALGLTNVSVQVADVQSFDPGPEPFDYIIAHGFYSWIPPEAREATLALMRRNLAPTGVAFLSFNAHPGGHIRQIVRDLMLIEVKGITDPVERALRARRKLQAVVADYPETDVFRRALKTRCQVVLEVPEAVLLHDDLAEISQPFYLHEVLERAAAHGLGFLTEADPTRAMEGLLPEGAQDDGGLDVAARAQEQDFRIMHGFRQTLLVRAETVIDRRQDPTRLANLYVASPSRAEGPNSFDTGQRHFEVADPELARAITRMAEAWPCAVPVAGLVEGPERLAALLRMYAADLVQLHVEPSPFTTTVSERPTASPLVRLQIAQGETRLITLSHSVTRTEDSLGRAFISCLDGSRTHAEIAAHMAELAGSPLEAVAAKLPERLESLARMPMLVG